MKVNVICLYSFLSVTKLMTKEAESKFSLIKVLNIDWAMKMV